MDSRMGRHGAHVIARFCYLVCENVLVNNLLHKNFASPTVTTIDDLKNAFIDV